MREYDIIVVGGGLGGASLAKAMAEHDARVLVLERERRFKDRVRGEGMWPWGTAELKELGFIRYSSMLAHARFGGSIPTSESCVLSIETCRLRHASKLRP
jgi:flavin-dependent dehydrogenase